MSAHYWPVPYTAPPPPSNTCADLARLAILGAVVGGSAAAGRGFARVQRGEIDDLQALTSTGRSALASAVAAAAAGAAAGAVADQGLLRLGVMFAAGATVMYAMERGGRQGETQNA